MDTDTFARRNPENKTWIEDRSSYTPYVIYSQAPYIAPDGTQTSLCLSVLADSRDRHAKVCVDVYRGLHSQKWYVIDKNSDKGGVVLGSVHNNMAINVPSCSKQPWTQIQIFPRAIYGQEATNGAPNERFLFSAAFADGSVGTLIGYQSNLALDVPRAVPHEPILQQVLHGAANQQWRLQRVEDPLIPRLPSSPSDEDVVAFEHGGRSYIDWGETAVLHGPTRLVARHNNQPCGRSVNTHKHGVGGDVLSQLVVVLERSQWALIDSSTNGAAPAPANGAGGNATAGSQERTWEYMTLRSSSLTENVKREVSTSISTEAGFGFKIKAVSGSVKETQARQAVSSFTRVQRYETENRSSEKLTTKVSLASGMNFLYQRVDQWVTYRLFWFEPSKDHGQYWTKQVLHMQSHAHNCPRQERLGDSWVTTHLTHTRPTSLVCLGLPPGASPYCLA